MNDLIFVHQETTFVVIDKPSGLLSVAGRGPGMQDCIVTRLKAIYPECIEHPAVHRLDMDTSGLMVLGLTKDAQRNLTMQFEQRRVEKAYLAILDGIIEQDEGRIELAFRLDPDNRPHQVYDSEHGKLGITQWRKILVENGCTRIEFTPLTGRTHQLRLHASHELGLGCPIVGDRLYGTATEPGQLKLHAATLAFDHPVSGKRLCFKSLPKF